MVTVTALWLPIVIAAVLVFVASSIIHMVLGLHNSDYKGHPKETELRAALREVGLSPGTYTFTHCASSKEMGSPEMLEKYNEGPVGFMTVLPTGPPAMGKSLVLWFGYSLLVGFCTAYIAGRTLMPGADYLMVFRVVGATSFMAYGVANFVDSVWKAQAWGVTLKHVFDGLVYASLTAGAFGWLWPS